MLKVASFGIQEEEKINSLLSHHPLAAGMHILVSEGKILIPYEDGSPEPKEVTISAIGEQKNTMLRQIAIIEHSQRVNEKQIADAKDAVNGIEANPPKPSKGTYVNADDKKSHEQRLKIVKGNLANLESQYMMNKAEIDRLKFNIDCYDEQIASLS